MAATCNSVDGCCAPPMCANAGTQLNCIFNDIGTLIKPFAPAINQKISSSGKPSTVASFLGTFSSNQMLVIGLVVFAIIVAVEMHK